jgi:hypothetical protein
MKISILGPPEPKLERLRIKRLPAFNIQAGARLPHTVE